LKANQQDRSESDEETESELASSESDREENSEDMESMLENAENREMFANNNSSKILAKAEIGDGIKNAGELKNNHTAPPLSPEDEEKRKEEEMIKNEAKAFNANQGEKKEN
jgi:hypothetical protein